MSDTIPLLIGLAGKRGSGKDTAFECIKEITPHLKVVRRGFADKLKLSFARIFYPNINLEDALELCNAFKEDGFLDLAVESGRGAHTSGRVALQRYGTESHRAPELFGDDFWVDALLPFPYPHEIVSGWSNNFDNADIAVITDVRFINEAERVNDLGGLVWKIVRPESEKVEDSHASEVVLPDDLVHTVIENNGSIQRLKNTLYDKYDNLYG